MIPCMPVYHVSDTFDVGLELQGPGFPGRSGDRRHTHTHTHTHRRVRKLMRSQASPELAHSPSLGGPLGPSGSLWVPLVVCPVPVYLDWGDTQGWGRPWKEPAKNCQGLGRFRLNYTTPISLNDTDTLCSALCSVLAELAAGRPTRHSTHTTHTTHTTRHAHAHTHAQAHKRHTLGILGPFYRRV